LGGRSLAPREGEALSGYRREAVKQAREGSSPDGRDAARPGGPVAKTNKARPVEPGPQGHALDFVLPSAALEIRYYLYPDGQSPFEKWFTGLDAPARAKVTTAIVRLEQGNLSNVKGVGEGLLEYRINFGPGYRVYFGRDGEVLLILLTGGTKKRQ
jgi:putative addiction module killer protein